MMDGLTFGPDILSGALLGGLPQVRRLWPPFPYRPPDQVVRPTTYGMPEPIDFGQENRQVADPNAAFIPPTPSPGLKALMDAYRQMGALKGPEPAPPLMLPKVSPWSLLGLGVIGALDPTKTVVPGFAQGFFQGGQMNSANENARRQNEADAAERAARAQLGMAQVQYQEEQQQAEALRQAEGARQAAEWKQREFERLMNNDIYNRWKDAEAARVAAEQTNYLRGRAVIEDQAKAVAGVESSRKAAVDDYNQSLNSRFAAKQGPWTKEDVAEWNQKRIALKNQYGQDIGNALTPVPRLGATSVASGNLAARESETKFNQDMRQKEFELSERRLSLEERKAAETVVKEDPNLKKRRGELEDAKLKLETLREADKKGPPSLGRDKQIADLESKVRVWTEAVRRLEQSAPQGKRPPAMPGKLGSSPTVGTGKSWGKPIPPK